MGISPEALQQVIATARQLEQQGFFEEARKGDQRASSLFARLVAYTLNPTAAPNGWGWLSKAANEHNVDGWAEDAIVLGNNPADLENVVDLVNGAGAAGASIGGGVKPRREHNRWSPPQPLSAGQLLYLRPQGAPKPPPPAPTLKPREQFYAEFKAVNAFYESPDGLKRPGGMVIDSANPVRCDAEAMAAWGYDLMIGKTVEQCTAEIRNSDEWKGKHR